jgi:DNA invertase Pin-like site-specific DNA recombinase
MKRFGYARCSTVDQDLSIQRAALEAAGCDMIREEKVSGRSRQDRTELQILLDFIGRDDVIVVTKLDRLGRNLKDILNICAEVLDKGAKLQPNN